MQITFGIDKGNNKRELYFIDQTVEQSCKMLFTSFKNNHKIIRNSQLNFLSNRNKNLFYLIAIHLIIQAKSSIYFLPLHINTYSYKNKQIYINNCSILLNILVHYKRFIQHIMANESRWKIFFDTLNDLMNNKRFIMSSKYLNIIKTLANTSSYWRYNHLVYLSKIGFLKTLSTALINGYFNVKKNSPLLRSIITHFIKLYLLMAFCDDWKYDISYTYNYANKFKYYVQKDLKRLKSSRNKQAYRNYNEQVEIHFGDICKFHRDINVEEFDIKLPFIDNINYEEMNVCANRKCKMKKSNDLKMCKQCKVVYYCSRKCQKYDWKHLHRTHCILLNNILFKKN